jgi:hypothetical protein
VLLRNAMYPAITLMPGGVSLIQASRTETLASSLAAQTRANADIKQTKTGYRHLMSHCLLQSPAPL